jgi:hypothetical protein
VSRIGSVRLTREIAPARDIDALDRWAGDPAVAVGGKDRTMNAGGRRPAHGGPPKRADDQTGSGTSFAAAVAVDLPGVVEQRAGAMTTFAVAAKSFLVVEPDDLAALTVDPASAEPFRVRLTCVPRDEVRSLIERAWRHVAPERLRVAHEEAVAARPRALTVDDVRKVLLALPAVAERARSLRTGDSIDWETGRKMFVMYGRASNLLPPDIDDTLMIRCCPDRPAVLAESPDRFFITVHYGDPDEPGAVLTRLSENTTDHIDELAELIEESWRAFAPRRVLAGYVRGPWKTATGKG